MAKGKREELVYLEDILESIGKIESYCEGISEIDFLSLPEKQDAIVRRLEIIGEAVKQLDQATRDAYPEIQWKAIAGMRDVLIHQYFGVSMEMVWQVIIHDLPKLRIVVQAICDQKLENI